MPLNFIARSCADSWLVFWQSNSSLPEGRAGLVADLDGDVLGLVRLGEEAVVDAEDVVVLCELGSVPASQLGVPVAVSVTSDVLRSPDRAAPMVPFLAEPWITTAAAVVVRATAETATAATTAHRRGPIDPPPADPRTAPRPVWPESSPSSPAACSASASAAAVASSMSAGRPTGASTSSAAAPDSGSRCSMTTETWRGGVWLPPRRLRLDHRASEW